MYYYTTTIDEQGIDELVAAVEKQVNGYARKGNPFKIVQTEQVLDEALPLPVTDFHLCLTGDMTIKNDRQAMELYKAMVNALDEVRKLNEGNYIVVRKKRS